MRVRLLTFGLLKDLLPSNGFFDLPAGSTVAGLLEVCRQSSPGNDSLWKSLAVAVNREYVAAAHTLHEGDEVALLPPVSGGSPQAENLVQLTREPIDAQSIAAALKHPEDGALAIFDGIVRNHTRGRRTLYLDYEAYEQMALQQMQQLAAEAIEKFPIRQAALVHRLGKLEIGETSVLIAAASAHRAAAFDACRWLIDTLKKTVPIWKKEYFEDGAVWADGEPFPQEIGLQRHPEAAQ
jgi:molybdopterin synthase catalytic subunit